MKKYNAFTMVELIFSIAVMSFFMIALVFSVGKKAQQRAGEVTSGRVICYKDSEGHLNKIVELDYGKSIKVDKEENVDVCEYKLPQNIKRYTIDVIGGGGGASGLYEEPYVRTSDITGSVLSPFSCTANGTPSMPSYYTKLDSVGTTCKTLLSSYPYFNPIITGKTDTTQINYSINPITTITNQFSNIMDNATYDANVLKNITVSVAGGTGKGGETPAKCSLTRNFSVGNKVSCYSGYPATENYNWLDEEVWISPTSGQLIVDGQVNINAPGGAFSECGETNMFSSNPVCSAGQISNTVNATVSASAYTYNATIINNIGLSSGVAGKSGSYVRNESVELTDDIKIKPENIGSGGIAGTIGTNGTAGGETCFVIDEKTKYCASGGAGGSVRMAQSINPTKTLITNNKIVEREHPNNTFISTETELEGLISDYYTNVFFLMISAEQQQKYKGQAGKCEFINNKLICKNAQNSEEPSYGLGGSAAQSAIRYDYIKSFKLCNTTSNQCLSTPVHMEEFAYGKGSNGNGGAVIISW